MVSAQAEFAFVYIGACEAVTFISSVTAATEITNIVGTGSIGVTRTGCTFVDILAGDTVSTVPGVTFTTESTLSVNTIGVRTAVVVSFTLVDVHTGVCDLFKSAVTHTVVCTNSIDTD